ncbi:MAG TPA: porin [Caulobacteraceae bacterium]|nr:porin [Caulobacteraceae bacterium]
MTGRKPLLWAAAAAALVAGVAGGAQAQETATSWKGAPQFESGDFSFKVRGRVYYDVISQEQDFANPAVTDTNNQLSRLRTARVGVEGTWNQDWAYKAELSLVGGNAAWEDLVLEYKASDMTSLMVGNFKTVGFENVSSSRYTTFMERGPIENVLGIGRVMTAQAKMNGANWTAAVFVHGDSVNASDPAAGASEQVAFGGRGTLAPINTDTSKVHLGLWARKRDHADQSLYSYSVRANTAYGTQHLSSGGVGDTDTQIGAEALWIWNSVSVQGEYANFDVDRATGADPSGKAYYLSASWFPTGEMRNLDVRKGELGRTKILRPVTAGGIGAIELAVRYDNVDMTEFGAGGGEYVGYTGGATWYPFPYVRFMANYTQGQYGLNAANADVDVNTLQFRAQFDF